LARLLRSAPTLQGIMLAVAGGVGLAWGLFFLDPALAGLGMLLLGLQVGAAFLARLQASRVAGEIVRRVHGHPAEASVVVVRLSFDNASGFTPVVALIRDTPPTRVDTLEEPEGSLLAPPGLEAHTDYRVRPRAGKRFFGPLRVKVWDPLRLYEIEFESEANGEQYIAAVPVPAPPPGEVVHTPLEAAPTPARLVRGPGTEFYSIREYMEGDDYRLIEWKATARLQKLMVKELRMEAASPTLIVMAPGPGGDEGPPGETPFEVMARIAAGLAEDLAKRGHPLGYLALIAGDPVEAPPAPGQAGAQNVLQGLAMTRPQGPLDPEAHKALLREYVTRFFRGPGTVILFAGPGVIDEAQEIAAEALQDLPVSIALASLAGREVEIRWIGRG